MRAVCLFLAALFLAACSTSSKTGGPGANAPVVPAPSTTMARELTSKTVALVDVDEESGETRAYCTGVWVGPETILTAAHCVEAMADKPALRYAVREDIFVGGSTIEAKYPLTRFADALDMDEDHDLALLTVRGQSPSHGIAELGPSPEQGQYVQVMGHSKGLWWSYSSGDVAAIRFAPLGSDPMLWIQTTAPISPGNSGGGLFDDQGRLIGICSRGFGSVRLQNLNFFVHTEYLRPLLEKGQSREDH